MSRVATSSGHLFFALPVRRRPICACTFLLPPPRHPLPQPSPKSFSTIPPSRQDDLASTASEQPRWRAPPPRMVSRGASNRSFRPTRPFVVNEDPQKLDDVLIRVLGKDGDQLLTDEVKWLTVTHKSFDHGRRGFNDRLAYLGMLGHVLQLRSQELTSTRYRQTNRGVTGLTTYGRGIGIYTRTYDSGSLGTGTLQASCARGFGRSDAGEEKGGAG